MTHPLLDRARREGTPLIDGDQVTFVWVGDPGLYDVQLVGDFTRWSWGTPVTLSLVEPGLYSTTLTFEPDAYLEYGFKINEQRVDDPFNTHRAPTGLGIENYCFTMPALSARLEQWWEAREGVATGRVTEHRIENMIMLGTPSRRVWLYQPPVDHPVPLLVVMDGREYLEYVKLPTILDNLIAAGNIQPIALAMVENGGQSRFIEYMCNDATVGLLVRSVIPITRTHLNLIDPVATPGKYGILGASMGGLIGLWAALRLPEVFGQVISQSGAFGFDLNRHKTIIWDVLENLQRRPIRVWMDVGRYEWLQGVNREMHSLLTGLGYPVHYQEYSAGHNYTAWKYEIAAALQALYG